MSNDPNGGRYQGQGADIHAWFRSEAEANRPDIEAEPIGGVARMEQLLPVPRYLLADLAHLLDILDAVTFKRHDLPHLREKARAILNDTPSEGIVILDETADIPPLEALAARSEVKQGMESERRIIEAEPAREMPTFQTVLGVDEGDLCGQILESGRERCAGMLGFNPIENCTCHILAPCARCEGSPLVCLECGREIE